jgi:hypothetical protein
LRNDTCGHTWHSWEEEKYTHGEPDGRRRLASSRLRKKKIKLKRILERVGEGELYCDGTGYRQVVGCCGHSMEA